MTLPAAFILTLIVAGTAQAQTKGAFEKIRVFGPSLDGNLEGDDPTRDVFVYLPPSYADEPTRRYPVVYFLHGYTAHAEDYVGFLAVPDSADTFVSNGGQEMIVVMPDAFTVYSGSMYSNSLTTGDWEGFVARDLVGYIDANYRTLPNRNSRGLSGHSMGGYGTIRIGMKHPETFGALYAMSSCCLMNQAPSQAQVEAQLAQPANSGGGFANAAKAQAAAWAPNPDNPPLYFDWPYKDGELQPLVQAKWIANSPLVMVDQYVPSLKSYSGGIAIDVGDMDTLGADNTRLNAALNRLGVDHGFEVYGGDHMNRVNQRFLENVLPFFSETLE
jgi:S-formylglutathione hydrolase FrmB